MKKSEKIRIAIFYLTISLSFLGFIHADSLAGSWNGWIYQDIYPTSNNLDALKFVTPEKGWIAGELGSILHTEDGGDNWEYQKTPTEKTIKSIFFINEQQGWAVGGEDGSAEKKGVIISTSDGGKTWVSHEGEYHSTLNKVFFLNENEGWIVGNQGVVLNTTNAGKTWRRVRTVGLSRSIASIHFINSEIGWLLAGDEIFRTADGGKTWESIRLDISPTQKKAGRPIQGMNTLGIIQPEWNQGEIYFINEMKGWAVTGFSDIFSTDDGGKTWINLLPAGGESYKLRRLSFRNDKRGCVSGSTIICTADGGKTWQERLGVRHGTKTRINNSAISLQDISFINQTMAWTVGKDGQILKTEDGGKTWQSAARSTGCGPNSFFVNKKTGWLHGYGSSFICRTDDAGRSFIKQQPGINVLSVFFLDSERGWAAGATEEKAGQETFVTAAIVNTNDGGKTWKIQFQEFLGNSRYIGGLFNIFFLDHKSGWAVGKKGVILHTEDGGEHWSHQASGDANFDLTSVRFVDSRTGWIIGTKITDSWSGIVLKTIDGGKRWNVQYSRKNMGLESMFFIDKYTGWVSGATEWSEIYSLFRTSDGGKTWTESIFGRLGTGHPAFTGNKGVFITDKNWFAVTKDSGKTWEKGKRFGSKYPVQFLELLEQ